MAELEPDPKEKEPGFKVALCNPEIVKASEEMNTAPEGCLSIPGWIGDVPRHSGLPHPLAEADHGERRRLDRMERRRVEAEVRAHVRQPERERARRPEHPFPWSEHRFVGEVDDEIRLDRVERVDKRHAVIVASPELLRPPDE